MVRYLAFIQKQVNWTSLLNLIVDALEAYTQYYAIFNSPRTLQLLRLQHDATENPSLLRNSGSFPYNQTNKKLPTF